MQKHAHPFLLLVLLIVVACGDSPTSPAETLFSLNGRVTTDSGGLAGATVTIMDGVNAGEGRTTDATGNYSFTNLTPSVFTLQAAASDYISQNKSVNLTTSNETMNFALVKPDPIFVKTGIGDAGFNLPPYVRRLRIQGSYSGSSSKFIVWINEFLLVNIMLGTDWESTTFDGTYSTCASCVVEIEHSNGVSWVFTEVR